MYSQSLVPFLLKILKIPLSSSSPIIFHSRGGLGRTGTILLTDMSLRMAAKEKALDILNCLNILKKQKLEIVGNVEQYKMAHVIILECLRGFRTSLPCNKKMEKSVRRIIHEWFYAVQMDYLEDTDWQKYVMDCESTGYEQMIRRSEKNRFQEIVPTIEEAIILEEYPDGDPWSSYINAVQVDGFKCPGKFIVTQQPMPNTLGDFWRMVVEKKSKFIISLNDINLRDQTCCEFWPTEPNPEMDPVDFIHVSFKSVNYSENYDDYSVKVRVRNQKSEEVNIIIFKRWSPRIYLPPDTKIFLDFLEKIGENLRDFRNIIITCFDGVKASGLYVALSFVIEKMKIDLECDVCLAVRTIRHNRKQFVKDESQFIFLYEAALLYYMKKLQ